MGNQEWNEWKQQHIAWNFVTGDLEDNDSRPKALGEQASSSPALPYNSISRHLVLFQSTPSTLLAPTPAPTSQSFQSTPSTSLAPAPAPTSQVFQSTPPTSLAPTSQSFQSAPPTSLTPMLTPMPTSQSFQSTPLTSLVPVLTPTSQLSNNIQEHVHARADYTSNLHHLLNIALTGGVEAHRANRNNHEVIVVPSTRALEGFTGMYTGQMATCNSDSYVWGHNMSLTQFLHAPLSDSVIASAASSFWLS